MNGYLTNAELLLNNVAIEVAMNEIRAQGKLAHRPSEFFGYIQRRRDELVALCKNDACYNSTVGHSWIQTLSGGIVCEHCCERIDPTDVINNMASE